MHLDAETLSRMLRGMARRHGALRRAYNGTSIDPWEIPDYCANATPTSPCGPALRASGLCVGCLHEENRKLRAAVQRARAIRDSASGTRPVADPSARAAIVSTARLILGEQDPR